MQQISEAALVQRRAILNAIEVSGANLNEFLAPHRDDMGLTPEWVKQEPEFIELQLELSRNEAILREYYLMYPRDVYKKEFSRESKAARGL